MTRAKEPLQLVVVTGLSGSGKSSAIRVLEDLGFYCIDNMPVALISRFVELWESSQEEVRRVALGLDVRERHFLDVFPRVFEELRERGVALEVLYFEASDEVLVRRFSETRRPHPLGTNRSVQRSIQSERRKLAPIRALADVIIDTSKFNVHDLRETIVEKFRGEREESKIVVYVTSFGYRHGVPADSDLVFDVRFLPNPNYIPAFKKLTGRNPKVARYIRSFPQTVEFIERISDLLIYLLPHYIGEGKSYLTIGFGCTGGHHRSVMIAEQIHKSLSRAGYRVKINHRDLTKPV